MFFTNTYAATIEEKVSRSREDSTYFFNAGNCSFLDGTTYKCISKEAKAKISYLENKAATDLLELIRNDCTWFDIYELEKFATSTEKQNLFDKEGYFIGNSAKKYVKVRAKYLCERPLM